jgi:hypothetical protein
MTRSYRREAGKDVLVPFPGEQIKAWAISGRINSPRNNDERFLEPIGSNIGGQVNAWLRPFLIRAIYIAGAVRSA